MAQSFVKFDIMLFVKLKNHFVPFPLFTEVFKLNNEFRYQNWRIDVSLLIPCHWSVQMETFKSPTELNFDSPMLADDWKLFKQQPEIFLVVSKRNGELDEVKITSTILLNVIGPEGLKVFIAFPYSEELEKHLKVILKESNSFEEVYVISKDQQFARNSQEVGFAERIHKSVEYWIENEELESFFYKY